MKILMATMSLGIGGAETHIVELAKELAARGHSITVASNGGVYIAELEKRGVKHIKVPFHSKSPANVARSSALLRRELAGGGYDVVHAHARIPAFICGRVCRATGTRFVTTVHGVYKLSPLLRLASDWGEKTLAVSCDVKQYLIDGYGIPSDSVTVTINGIDTEKFKNRRSERHSNGLETELGLDPACAHRLLWVSRADVESAHVAFMLAESAPRLRERFPDLEIVMVGAGTAYAELEKAAEAANAVCGCRTVILTGARADVERFPSLCDAFVGVSRSAMEAMASELPVVLAGSQGYLGILRPELKEKAVSTNFCCRDERFPDAGTVARDVAELLSMSESERAALGAWGRAQIIEDYSVRRMADDAEKLYDRVRPFKRYDRGEIMLSGYYGFGNTGDDSLLQLICEALRARDRDLRLTVISKKPRQTAARYGVRSVGRFDLIGIAREMRRAKLLVCGGGTLLQNSTSTRSLFYYTHIMKMAKDRGMKLMLYASGIGPLRGERAREMARRALASADAVTLREETSLAELKSLGDHAKAVVTADPAFTLRPADEAWVKQIMRREGLERSDADAGFRYFALSLRGGTRTAPDFYDKAIEACKAVTKATGLIPLVIPLQPAQDGEICRRAADAIGGKLVSGLCASELAGLCAHTAFAAGMRLHILIYAATVGVPVLGLACDPKISAFAALAGLERYCLPVTEEFSPADFAALALELCENRAALSESVRALSKRLAEASVSDADRALALLGR